MHNPRFSAYNLDMEKHLATQSKRITVMQDNLYEDKLQSVVSQDVYHKKSEQFAERSSKIENRLDELSEYSKKINQIIIYNSKYALKNLYVNSDRIDKRMIIDRLFKITTCNGEINVAHTYTT